MLKFRHRVWMLVVLAAIGLVTVTVLTTLLARHSQQQLDSVETRYVPLLELDRDLKSDFEAIRRGLENAAAAGEDSGLRDSDRLAQRFAARLVGAEQTLADNGGNARELEAEFRAYYAIAREVSAQLVAGAPAAELGGKVDAMRRAQEVFALHLDTATTPDRSRLAAAFEDARDSQRDALVVEIAVGAGALALMALLSWQIIRRTLRGLREVSRGMERLARGEPGREIDVRTSDEIGDLAREANRTADQLREYRESREQAQRELEDKAAELARISQYKSQFLANMSHELRTPLNSIMILSKILADNEDGRLDAKQAEFASLIHRSGDELLTLINDVLDLAKVEAGKQEISCAPLGVAAVADYLRGMFTPLAAQKRLGFEVELAPGLPSEIRTDWNRLTQILKNLIANALKFTARGRVTVRLSREAPPALGEVVDPLVISVVDTGIGIAPDKHVQIFEAFAQAEGGTSRKYGGSGLGLTIGRELARRLGGDLVVESELGIGSTFHLALPIAGPQGDVEVERRTPVAPVAVGAARSVPPIDAPASEDVAGLEGKTVLIVDDDMRNVYSLASALRARKLEVLTAADGQEALDELAGHPETDVVLMDLMMPNLDGHEATRRIRAQQRFHSLPIIAITARTMPGEREKCLDAGASDYVPKPVDVTRLLALLRTWLG